MEEGVVRCDLHLVDSIRTALMQRYADRLSPTTELMPNGKRVVAGFRDSKLVAQVGVGCTKISRRRMVDLALVLAYEVIASGERTLPWDVEVEDDEGRAKLPA